MKKKGNKNKRSSFSKNGLIKEELTKASIDLMKMIIYDFWKILLMWILYNLIEKT